MESYRRSKLSGPPPPLSIPRRANLPVSHRTQKQLRRITPDSRYEDPYIAAVLIALAQEQGLCEKASDDNNEIPYSAASAAPLQMLLASGPYNSKWLHIYTSKVSPEFLAMLNRLSLPPPAGAQHRPGMVIYRRRLAFKPYETLSQRLAAVIQDARSSGEHGCRMEGGAVGQGAVELIL